MAQLRSLSINSEPVVDYIIERTTTSDGRVYTKWSSGRSKMEVSLTVEKHVCSTWGGGFLSSTDAEGTATSTIELYFDTSYFTSVTYANISVISTGYPAMVCYNQINADNISYYIWMPTKQDPGSFRVQACIEGTWK